MRGASQGEGEEKETRGVIEVVLRVEASHKKKWSFLTYIHLLFSDSFTLSCSDIYTYNNHFAMICACCFHSSLFNFDLECGGILECWWSVSKRSSFLLVILLMLDRIKIFQIS